MFTLEELPIATDLKLYDTLPVKSAGQLLGYLEFVKPKLNKINSPILVVQALNDDIVDPISADYIFDNVNSEKKEILYLERSTHINIIEKELLKQESFNFIRVL